jgi:hypothetical protein
MSPGPPLMSRTCERFGERKVRKQRDEGVRGRGEDAPKPRPQAKYARPQGERIVQTDHLGRLGGRSPLSKRRYSRLQGYAVPYNGEEMYLHWANADPCYEDGFRGRPTVARG